MPLFTNCILRERSLTEGIRISVMSRHTLSDGITPDGRITSAMFDEHLPQLGPHPKLIGDYYRRGLLWKDFESRYLSQIRSREVFPFVTALVERALGENITLLCIELTPEYCHRRVLAEECQRIEPGLRIECR